MRQTLTELRDRAKPITSELLNEELGVLIDLMEELAQTIADRGK